MLDGEEFKTVLRHQLEMRANDWRQMIDGALVHVTALVGFYPMNSKTFARPVPDALANVKLGKNVVIGPYAVVYQGVEIGDDTQVCPFAHIREGAKIGQRCIIGVNVKIGYDCQVGDDCQLMDDCHISGGTVIGDRCFLSVQVLAVNDDKPRGYEWKGVTPVTIGSDCVIGAGARLRPGISIGPGVTVGMGAVVTRDVERGAVVKGFPARPDPAAPMTRLFPDFVSG